jgi:hypothetical protein
MRCTQTGLALLGPPLSAGVRRLASHEMTEISSIEGTCASCIADGDLQAVLKSAAQCWKAERLAWEYLYFCPVCGLVVEHGVGPTPQDVREALLRSEGGFGLCVEELPRKQWLRAVAVLRDELGWTMEQAAAAVRERSRPLHTGTRAEIERLIDLLRAREVSASLEQL